MRRRASISRFGRSGCCDWGGANANGFHSVEPVAFAGVHGPDGCGQFILQHVFGQITAGPGGHGSANIFVTGENAEGDDARAGKFLSDGSDGVEPVRGHIHVHEADIGPVRAVELTAWTPLIAVAVTTMSACAPMMVWIPTRVMKWSSAIRTRTRSSGRANCVFDAALTSITAGERYRDLDFGPGSGVAFDLEIAACALRPFSHTQNAKVPAFEVRHEAHRNRRRHPSLVR
jgi:hypothetical protein